MPNPPNRPNRPAARPGATANDPNAQSQREQPPPTTGAAAQQPGTATGAGAGGAGAGAGAALQQLGQMTGGSNVPLADVFNLAQWAAFPSDDEEETNYRRGQVRNILYGIVDGMFAE